MRTLVAIAHHGTKNRPHLERMLETFRTMDFDIDVVVLSEKEKEFSADVEVRVGLPTSDPWSLPFGHRELFADRQEDYDLFVYAEDDTLIEQRHLEAFVELSEHLPADHLPGALRYEVDGEGRRSYCSFHSHYRWVPSSVFRTSGLTFARFTNDHAAWYALTRKQLKAAIASGGFLVPPHQGWYDMLVSAATDVFTQCGFQRVICIERVDDQLVHHLPNVYLGKFGIDEASFRAQCGALVEIGDGTRSPDQLVEPETRIHPSWHRHAYVHRPRDASWLVGGRPARVLSVGAASGSLESTLIEHGHHVTSIPVDAVFDVVLQARGISTTSLEELHVGDAEPPRTFDRILAIDLLAYVEDPGAFLRGLGRLLRSNGRLLFTVPDHGRYHLRDLLLTRSGSRPLPTSFVDDGIHAVSGSEVRRWLHRSGLDVVRFQHRRGTRRDPIGRGGFPGRLAGNSIIVMARRQHP